MAVACLLGCKKENQASQQTAGLHDPLLKQQLTTMIASLDDNNVKAADQAEKDLQAVLSVNRDKFSKEQKDKLFAAMGILSQSTVDYYVAETNHAADPKKPEPKLEKISEAKTDLSELAASL